MGESSARSRFLRALKDLGPLTRRRFFGLTGGVMGSLLRNQGLGAQGEPSAQFEGFETSGAVTRLSPNLAVFHGPINVGILRNGNRAVFIDCAEGLESTLSLMEIDGVDQILFTHHHRDQVCGIRPFLSSGAKVGVPIQERSYFENPRAYWDDDLNHWRLYRSFRPHNLMLTEPVAVDLDITDGLELVYGPARIRIVETPGHTDGAVSYVVDVDGMRVAFCGDCIYDSGKLWDIFSLQRGFSKGGREIGGYHGFMGDRWRLVDSLRKIKAFDPGIIVPSHGKLLDDPRESIEVLDRRLETAYEQYVGISALRHYFPELFTEYAGRSGQMPIREGITPPGCLLHFGTTWMLRSESGAAFVMDVGSPETVEEIRRVSSSGRITGVEGLWITHYHFDHTDGVPLFQREFDCPTYTDRRLAEVLVRPEAWRLPCLAPDPVRVERPMEDGESWDWHEFKMTSYYYPGQTLYHAALLVQTRELRMLFVGDSHTMAGIDDYCAYNRNWLGKGVGFQSCLSLIEELRPTHIFNCHVEKAFTFNPEELRFMQRNLEMRLKSFGDLFPWAHPNQGMDPYWVRTYPYKQEMTPGQRGQLKAVVTNHSDRDQPAECRLQFPHSWGGASSAWCSTHVPAGAEQEMELSLEVPQGVKSGRQVITLDVRFGDWLLPRFSEAIVDVV